MVLLASGNHFIMSRNPLCYMVFAMVLAAGALAPGPARADEDGVSFWLPGTFSSMAAVPPKPGWSVGTFYYHMDVDGGGEVAAARLFTIGDFERNVDINLNVALTARPDLIFAFPTHTFKEPALGGRLSLGVGLGGGYSDVSLDGTLTLRAGDAIVTRQGSLSDSRWGFADLYPQAALRWNRGLSNYLIYAMGDIPVGTYDADRLANFGIGHAAIDAGVGYTYFNPQKGQELSAVTGFTYNWENEDTDYQNGVDWHLDMAASQFLSKRVHIGAVAYIYQQIEADKGAPEILGEVKSRVMGAGPQVGYFFPINGAQGYLSLKGYGEFDADHRADGWNVWLTFVVAPGGDEG